MIFRGQANAHIYIDSIVVVAHEKVACQDRYPEVAIFCRVHMPDRSGGLNHHLSFIPSISAYYSSSFTISSPLNPSIYILYKY